GVGGDLGIDGARHRDTRGPGEDQGVPRVLGQAPAAKSLAVSWEGADRSAMSNDDASRERTRIRVSGAAKCFGPLQVFRDINLSVGLREIVALVGPSGCGKTTLLRCLDGLIPISEGEILVDGQPVSGPPPSVAVVFQHFGLFPWKTVRANVAYGL